MRLLEILIPAILAIYLMLPLLQNGVLKQLPYLTLFLLIPHFLLEGYRWQMIPLYAATIILAALAIFQVRIKPIASYLSLGLLALLAALPILLPVPHIPAPGGPYSIGTSSFEMVDSSRKELYSGKDEPRRFMIQVWYPADVKSTDKQAPWMNNADIFTPAISSFINMPPFFLDHLALVKLPAYENARPAKNEKGFPVIIFSHGWKGFNAQNAGQALELASHGYVVIAIQHTYGAITTVFPDGTIAPNNPNALPNDDFAPDYEDVARILADQWAGDISFTLDQASAWNEAADNDFFQSMDMNRVGVYGHSTGGGAVVQFCGVDPRCKAILGMDPFMRPVSLKVIEQGLSQPSFFMFSQSWADNVDSKNNEWFNRFYPNLTDNYGVIKIEGTKHYDFSDIPLLSPIAPQLGLKGPLNGKEVTTIVNSYLIEFFESALSGKTSTLFDGKFDKFQEVKKLK